MKRYRIVGFTYNTSATLLGMKILPEWDAAVRESWRVTHARVREGLQTQFGTANWDRKERDLVELGAAPFSVVGYHTAFLREARDAFTVGAYYPALTAASCLGERILNHLVLRLRDDFAHIKLAKPVTHRAISNWPSAINALEAWDVLLPPVAAAFRHLEGLRNRSIHFNPGLEKRAREDALEALALISRVVGQQFGVLQPLPWLIPCDGVAFLRREVENRPFIREFYLPACQRVGPDHEMEVLPNGWRIIDHSIDSNEEVSDEEFIRLHGAAQAARAARAASANP